MFTQIMDRYSGHAAGRVAELNNASVYGSLRGIDRRVSIIERELAFGLRVPNIIRAEQNNLNEVTFSRDGIVEFSSDQYLDIERTPNRDPHHLKWLVDLEQIADDLCGKYCPYECVDAEDCCPTATVAIPSLDVTVEITGTATGNVVVEPTTLDLGTLLGCVPVTCSNPNCEECDCCADFSGISLKVPGQTISVSLDVTGTGTGTTEPYAGVTVTVVCPCPLKYTKECANVWNSETEEYEERCILRPFRDTECLTDTDITPIECGLVTISTCA